MVSASVGVTRSSGQPFWSASTSTQMELSNNEALFVYRIMAGVEINDQPVQLGLGQALTVLNAMGAEHYNNGWDGVSNILSHDTLKKILLSRDLGVDDVTEH